MDFEIVAGERIGIFHLGSTLEQLKVCLKNQYKIELREDCLVVKSDNLWFWLDVKTNVIYQIMALNSFNGKFLGEIGIGDTLSDVEFRIGKWKQEYDVYELPKYKGICFQLKDVDYEEKWDELSAPFESISIYKI